MSRVIFTDDESRFISYRVKPQLKTLGPKYGKLLPKISAYLESADAGEIVKAVEDGVYEFETDGVDVTLNKEDLQIFTDSVTGYVSESDRGITAVLDTNLTEELIGEGIAREIISKIQTMRKEGL